MPKLLAVIDSGTTRTRLRLWNSEVVWAAERSVGARDVVADGNNLRLRQAVAELLEQAKSQADLEAIIASGMITSNVGLLEVPHITAPAGADTLATGIVLHNFPDLGPIHFIPGVKTLPPILSAETLHLSDVLRGEEVEVVGLRELLGLSVAVTFLHFGSHHKAVDCDATGRIIASRTALTGEAFAALTGHTILKSSVLEISEMGQPDPVLWRAGLEAAQAHGFGRALFMVRLGQQLWGQSRAAMSAYLLGVLDSLTLPLLHAPFGPLVLYGRSNSASLMAAYLEAQDHQVIRVDEAIADTAAALGAVRVFEKSQKLKAKD